jgi:hypothetical protein
MITMVVILVVDVIAVGVFEVDNDCLEQGDEWLSDDVWDGHGLVVT